MYPNPGLGAAVDNSVLQTSGASLNAEQIPARYEAESRPALDFAPLTINVGLPLTPYCWLSAESAS